METLLNNEELAALLATDETARTVSSFDTTMGAPKALPRAIRTNKKAAPKSKPQTGDAAAFIRNRQMGELIAATV